MEDLLERVGSRFALVTLSGMRACEINDYYNQLGDGLGAIVPPQVTSLARKPLSIAMEEIEVGKIKAVPLPTEEQRAAEAEARSAASSQGVDDTARATPREKREPLWKVRPAPVKRTRTNP
jgi:DNA-directed RNA polymerase subunit omega